MNSSIKGLLQEIWAILRPALDEDVTTYARSKQMTEAKPSDGSILSNRDDLEQRFTKSLLELQSLSSGAGLTDVGHLPPVTALCLDSALQLRLEKDTDRILKKLADLSRETAWRKPFGTSTSESGATSLSEPTCILDVALKILSRGNLSSHNEIREALRLIANCCADQNENRRHVVDKGAISQMIRLSSLHAHVDFIIPAIYNICVDFPIEDGSQDAAKTRSETSPPSFNEAEKQLSEAQDCNGLNALLTLLGLWNDIMEDRQELLVDVIEMASRPARMIAPIPATGDDTDKGNHESGMSLLANILKVLVITKGPEIARTSRECRISICSAVQNLLSQATVKQSLISIDGINSFIAMPFPADSEDEEDEQDDLEIAENLGKCQKAFLKLTYEISSMAEFEQHYSVESPQIQLCITHLQGAAEATKGDQPQLNRTRQPLSCLCVVLANLTTTIKVSEAFVQKYKIHQSLFSLLGHSSEPDVLLPALSLLVKLALSDSNKETMIKDGISQPILRILETSTTVDVQREAVVLTRLLIKVQPNYISRIGATEPTLAISAPYPSPPSPQHYPILARIFALFHTSRDGSTKLEIGRLAIELSRTLFRSSSAATTRPELAEKAFVLAVGSSDTTAAEAMTFVARHATTPDSQAEGWFGLAMLSVWERGRSLVLSALQKDDMLKEMGKVVVAASTGTTNSTVNDEEEGGGGGENGGAGVGGGASYQNLRLVLAKMHLIPKNNVNPETRAQLDQIARLAGLRPIWSE